MADLSWFLAGVASPALLRSGDKPIPNYPQELGAAGLAQRRSERAGAAWDGLVLLGWDVLPVPAALCRHIRLERHLAPGIHCLGTACCHPCETTQREPRAHRRLELGPEARGGREGAGGCCSRHESPQTVNSGLWEKLPHPRGEAAECRRSGTEAQPMRKRVVGPHAESTVHLRMEASYTESVRGFVSTVCPWRTLRLLGAVKGKG